MLSRSDFTHFGENALSLIRIEREKVNELQIHQVIAIQLCQLGCIQKKKRMKKMFRSLYGNDTSPPSRGNLSCRRHYQDLNMVCLHRG